MIKVPKDKTSFGTAVIVLALLILFLSVYGSNFHNNFPRVDRSSWQAVFLSNDQVYFGHLTNYNDAYVTLSSVFYLRVGVPLQQGLPEQSNVNLVKLGSELHGPQDLMYIPKDKIMFWENMKSDSQVVQAISNFLAAQ